MFTSSSEDVSSAWLDTVANLQSGSQIWIHLAWSVVQSYRVYPEQFRSEDPFGLPCLQRSCDTLVKLRWRRAWPWTTQAKEDYPWTRQTDHKLTHSFFSRTATSGQNQDSFHGFNKDRSLLWGQEFCSVLYECPRIKEARPGRNSEKCHVYKCVLWELWHMNMRLVNSYGGKPRQSHKVILPLANVKQMQDSS